ncbi:hypothetical protein DNTS_029660 [Danionella cerebrum]|uniref:Protein LBH n=1 Tax=Danionella cerebrum TaxID=2873325 RepID=A0A553QFL8_9TELE|nr:hypothetical protein DNTS_029660 [Danionella translucida]
MAKVMISNAPMDNMRRLTFQIFPDPSDSCKLKERLPSIVVEETEGEVESGELRWPPEELSVRQVVVEEADEEKVAEEEEV